MRGDGPYLIQAIGLQAAQHGTAGVLVLLLEAGASTTCRNVDGQLAVDRAREGEHQNVLGLCGKEGRHGWPVSIYLPIGRGWPRLAEAGGRPELDLALAGCAGGRFGRSWAAAISHTGARPAHGARPQLGWRAASRMPMPAVRGLPLRPFARRCGIRCTADSD